MRNLWADNRRTIQAHHDRSDQVDRDAPEARLPPYLESFLAHLRMLVGVPFRYLVPDERLLPKESIRFFYVDRSWTDRLVDGAMAVGKIGTRELALHQGHAEPIKRSLDVAQRVVRTLQRGRNPTDYRALVDARGEVQDEETPITGFLLRSALVSGWPHMDVRAYDWPDGIASPPDFFDPAELPVGVRQLEPLRIERLSPSVMIALFDGEPRLVTLEQPHHGVQFGIIELADGRLRIPTRNPDGTVVDSQDTEASVGVPFRHGGRRVVDVAELRDRLHAKNASRIPQRGSANFALSVLSPPFRQRFEGTVDQRGIPQGPSGSVHEIAPWVANAALRAKVVGVLTDGD